MLCGSDLRPRWPDCWCDWCHIWCCLAPAAHVSSGQACQQKCQKSAFYWPVQHLFHYRVPRAPWISVYHQCSAFSGGWLRFYRGRKHQCQDHVQRLKPFGEVAFSRYFFRSHCKRLLTGSIRMKLSAFKIRWGLLFLCRWKSLWPNVLCICRSNQTCRRR